MALTCFVSPWLLGFSKSLTIFSPPFLVSLLWQLLGSFDALLFPEGVD